MIDMGTKKNLANASDARDVVGQSAGNDRVPAMLEMSKTPAAINDNGGPGISPPPGAASAASAMPAIWSKSEPYVMKLADDVEEALEGNLPVSDRKLLDYLGGVVDGDGMLPSIFGRHSYRGICKAAGLRGLALRHNKPLRQRYQGLIDRFKVDDGNTFHGVGSFTKEPVTLHDRIKGYVADAIREKRSIPSDRCGRVSRQGVSDETGISLYKLSQTPYFKLILDALDAGLVQLGPVYTPGSVMTPEQRKARFEELKAVYDGFDVPGGKVPESKKRIGAVDWDYCASLTGVVEPTMRDYRPLTLYVARIVARRGTAMVGLTADDNSVAVVRRHIVDSVEKDQKARGIVSFVNVVAGHRSAYDRLVEAAGLEAEDDVAPAFGDEFQHHYDSVLRGVANPRTAANVGRFLETARELYLARLGADDLPAELGACLTHLIESNNTSRAALARAVECEAYNIASWQSGICSVSRENLPVLGRIEQHFKLPRGTLLEKASSTMGRMRKHGGGSDQWRALPSNVRALLPNEANEWSASKLADAVAKVKPLLACGTQYGRLCSLAHEADRKMPPYEPGDALRKQFDEFIAYKTAPITGDLNRSIRGVWKSEASVALRMDTIGQFFRIMTSPMIHGPNSGLGMDASDETFAWLAHTPLVVASIAQRGRRFADMDWNGRLRGTLFTSGEVNFAKIVASMTNAATGFLTQQPWLAQTLVPSTARMPAEYADALYMLDREAGALLLSDEDVAFARRDWPGYCRRNHRQLQQAIHMLGDEVEISRNPMESIEGLLRADEPLAEFIALAIDAEARWADARIHPFANRIDVRNSAMARIHPITGFRPENMSGLLFTGDHRGEIRKVDGVWQIEVSYKKFKNFNSCRLFGPPSARQNYRIDLNDQAGLYDVLDHYFFEALPGMRKENSGKAAFVTKSGKPMIPSDYRSAFVNYGAQHIAYNPVLDRGYPGVTSITPYAIRHLRATNALKNGSSVNRVEEAAFSIQTGEEMIRQHYGFMIPQTALVSSHNTFGRAAEKAMRRR
ncbi:hypothetical protein U1763_02515 [Sphingomonas sp. LB2R24]|uniref:hypothetical protein n=1 Tax=Sphingomonas sorbitolis TaxID=3096165 RepID=UPI002FCC7F89